MLFFKKQRFGIALSVCLAILLLLIFFSLSFGAVQIPLSEIFSSLNEPESATYRILRFIRLPRTLGAILCGTALSVSGLLIQSVLQNPLGSPNVLGMNSGAGLCVILCGAFFERALFLPAAAFFGAFASLLFVSILSKKAGASKSSIILSGVALNAFLIAACDAITILIPDTVYAKNSFRIGTLAGVQMDTLVPAAALIFSSLVLAFFLRNRIEILSLGDESAATLGMHVGRTRFFILILASVLCGAGISFAGLVGFVGLIVPHSARMILGGTEMKKLIPFAAVLGAILVLLCDLISRLPSHELPVGILLSAIGGPYFFFLLIKTRRSR